MGVTNHPVRYLAHRLLALGMDLLPPHRSEWGDAMHAEFQFINRPGSALIFAAGCLGTAISERNTVMTTMQKSMQTLTILALVGLAGATLVARPPHAPTAVLFALLGLAYAGTALLTFFRGSVALVRAAAVMLGLSATSYLTLIFVDLGLVNAELYRALASEVMALWIFLLGLGVAMRRSTAGRRCVA